MAGGTYKPGFHYHPPSFAHRFVGKALGATMWFWIMYRMREDGPVMLGWRHPWEGHGHGHGHEEEEGSHGHD